MFILVTLQQVPVTKQIPKPFITDTFESITYTNAVVTFGPNTTIPVLAKYSVVKLCGS